MPFQINVTVTNPDGQAVIGSGAFTVNEAPVFGGIAPSSGPQAGGTTVTISGQFFQAGATVLFGTRPASNVVVAADGLSLTCVVPSQL